MAQRRATVQSCDNPECDYEEVVVPGETPPFGYYLTKGQYHTSSGGGPLPKVYACCIDCLVPALSARIVEEEA